MESKKLVVVGILILIWIGLLFLLIARLYHQFEIVVDGQRITCEGYTVWEEGHFYDDCSNGRSYRGLQPLPVQVVGLPMQYSTGNPPSGVKPVDTSQMSTYIIKS